jgi:amidohydrolase
LSARDLAALRRELHRLAEPSNEEVRTSAFLGEHLSRLRPDELRTGLGGHGVLASFRGVTDGPSLLFRAELDALPIPETVKMEWASSRQGTSHKCGHDGHMTMLLGLAERMAGARPTAGTVHVLFQPAEETGEGAERVLEDPAFRSLRVDRAVALHNLPGFPRETVVVKDDLFAWASVGVEIRYTGRESHASEPENGISPAPAVAESILALRDAALPDRLPPGTGALTVTHAQVGAPSFGTSPGRGVVFATFRADSGERLDALRAQVGEFTERIARTHDLTVEFRWREPFPVTRADSAVVAEVEAAARDEGLPVIRAEQPFRWSEDFGHFTNRFPGALFGLGAGEDAAPLHHPEYDFPDDLLEPGSRLLARIAERLGAAKADVLPGGTR